MNKRKTILAISVAAILVVVVGNVFVQLSRTAKSRVKNDTLTAQDRQKLAEFTDVLRAGSGLLEGNSPAAALSKANEALELRPRNPEALRLRARANLQLNNENEALQDLFDIVTGNASMSSTLETDPVLIAETVLLAERTNDSQKLSVLMEKAGAVVSAERTNDGLPVPNATLSDKDRLLAIAAKRSFMRGEAADAIAFLVQVSDQNNEVIRYYRATAEQDSGNHGYAQELYKQLAADANVSAEIRAKAKARSSG